MNSFEPNHRNFGTLTSSARFKTDIQGMDAACAAFLGPRPVVFGCKSALDPQGLGKFGLRVEEVEQVNPALVAHDDQGRPFAARSHALN